MKKKIKLKAGLNRSIGGNIFVYSFIILMSLIFIFPFIYAVVNSLKPIDELLIFPPRLYVTKPTLNNYAELFRLAANSLIPLSRYIVNTLIIAVSITLGTIVIAYMAAYPLAFGKFPGKDKIFSLVVTSLLKKILHKFTGLIGLGPPFSG